MLAGHLPELLIVLTPARGFPARGSSAQIGRPGSGITPRVRACASPRPGYGQ